MNFIDNIKNKVKKKYEEKKEDWIEDREYKDQLREEIRTVRAEERKKQDIKTAIYKEQDKARKHREYIKNGGFMGKVSRGMDNLSKNLAEQEKQRARKQPKARARTKQKEEPREETMAQRMENFKLFE